MGMHFRMNFNHPYISTSLREFWTRWHISLSSWFRDYVYIPLGGTRRGKWRGLGNLWITMLLSGIWHGANFTFLAWGGIHSFFLSLERLTGWQKWVRKIPLGNYLVWALVMVQVVVAWVFFRAKDFHQAGEVLTNMFTLPLRPGFLQLYPHIAFFLGLGMGAELLWRMRPKMPSLRKLQRNPVLDALGIAILICLAIFLRGPQSQFIYFQF
jgi:alginate O-acetyltransferase complex protein AlgI